MKKIFQLLIVVLFIGASAYVVMTFFVNPQKNVEKLKEEASGSIRSVDVGNLIRRSFKTEQADILSDDKFQSLIDHSVLLSEPEELKTGKINPFEGS